MSELGTFQTLIPCVSRCLRISRRARGATSATGWKPPAPPKERLGELRRDYYYLFLQAERDLSAYLHDWYKDLPAHELLSGLRQFLDSVDLSKAGGFRSGQDHVSLVLEALAHLSLSDRGQAIRFQKLYVESWFGMFASRLGSEARSPFYLAAAKLAGGLERDLEAL